jgi:Transposase DDE domain
MSYTTKSPVAFARAALRAAAEALRPYAHRFSPKKFTQPQLFACLALKTFFKTDYRGITIYLEDLPDLARVLGLADVPHYTTLQKASKRLLKIPAAERLLTATVHRLLGRRRKVKLAAFDSTGLQCGHASSYYVRRRAKGGKGWQTTTYKHFAKLEAAFDCATHLVIGAIPRRGPRVDTDRFVPLLEGTLRRVGLVTVLADAGSDSEPNHQHAREKRGVRSVIPAEAGRPTAKPPTGRYRRLMKRRLDKDYCRYGQRWQAETGFSMIKRRLSAVVHARSYWAQCRELMLLAVVHNLMILAEW